MVVSWHWVMYDLTFSQRHFTTRETTHYSNKSTSSFSIFLQMAQVLFTKQHIQDRTAWGNSRSWWRRLMEKNRDLLQLFIKLLQTKFLTTISWETSRFQVTHTTCLVVDVRKLTFAFPFLELIFASLAIIGMILLLHVFYKLFINGFVWEWWRICASVAYLKYLLHIRKDHFECVLYQFI